MNKKATLLFGFILLVSSAFAISPYLYFGQMNSSTEKVVEQVKSAIETNGFEILGSYNPEGNQQLNVIAFTNDEIKKIAFGVEDRGALAAALKIAVVEKDGKPNIFLLNPEYIYWAYLRDAMDKTSVSLPLKKSTDKIVDALELLSTSPNGVGGNIDRDDLKRYRYMVGMERFTSPVELNEYSSFDAGLNTIMRNAKAGKGNTKLIYSIVDKASQTAVFGIGLLDKDEGEPFFLPIIGEDHAAALPYEIILQGKEATMLHGRYRIALHWPELSMATFTRIINTPGDIEDQFEAICE